MSRMNLGLIGIIGEEAKNDYWGTMQKVADLGYKGIEGAEELLQGDVHTNLKRFHDMGLQVLTTSASRELLRDDLDRILSNAQALQSNRVTVWWAPCESKDQLLRDAELYNAAGEKLAAEGLKLCYHNHDHEFKTTFNGLYALDILAEHTDPANLFFELDIAWITYGGADPVHILNKMAGRIPAIHVKDVQSLNAPVEFTAVGTGIVKIKESIQAAMEAGVEWMVVEQDHLRNLTGFETITLSYLYLKEAGLV